MMQFKPELITSILAGQKTQTRRLVKPGDSCNESLGQIHWVMNSKKSDDKWKRRIRWEAGKDYAVCPGRGKPQVARIRLLRIRREDVQDISHEDAVAEGCWYATYIPEEAKHAFIDVWIDFYDPAVIPMIIANQGQRLIRERPAELYQAWVLDFELIT